MDRDNKCPRCGERRLQSWLELDDDEREMVQRLPETRDYSLEERKQSHRWCTLCWFESTSESERAV